jgi:transposase-like protein
MGWRRFGREFKLEAVKLVRERGVTVAQAARDLDLHENLLRKWVKDSTRRDIARWDEREVSSYGKEGNTC